MCGDDRMRTDKGRCFIFGALPVGLMPERPAEDDLVIAADKGYDVAVSLGITPDIAVGDFDSLGRIPDAPEVIRLEVRKDDTDIEHAVNMAMGRGYTDIVVYGAAGGQLDHTLGNIAVAEHAANKGGRAVFYGDESSFTVIRNASLRMDRRKSGRITVMSLSKVSRGVSIRGLSYEVGYFDLPREVTRGVGNSFIGRLPEITVRDGTLLVVWDTVA